MNDRRDGADSEASQLALRIADGDRAAEAELVARYGSKIEFILRRHVRDSTMAADLCQDTLIIVIERLRDKGLDEPEKLAAFIHRTAINLARGEARTYYRRNTHADSERVELQGTHEPLMVERIAHEQLAESIRSLLGELRQPRDRQLLRRFYLSEESKASICQSLEVTPEHFDRILYRACQRFRGILETHLGKRVQRRFESDR